MDFQTKEMIKTNMISFIISLGYKTSAENIIEVDDSTFLVTATKDLSDGVKKVLNKYLGAFSKFEFEEMYYKSAEAIFSFATNSAYESTSGIDYTNEWSKFLMNKITQTELEK